MAWTHVIKDKQIIDGVLFVEVEYNNGTKPFTERYQTNSGLDTRWLKKRIGLRLEELASLDISYAGIALAVPEDLTPPAETPLPADVVDRNTWVDKFTTYRKAMFLVELGLVSADNTSIQNLKTFLINNFKVAYLDYVPMLNG